MLAAAPLAGAQSEQGAGGARNDVRPPASIYCEPDDHPASNRVVLDVTQDGQVLHAGTLVCSLAEERQGQKRLGELLGAWKQRPETKTEKARIGGQEIELVDDPILLRADRDTPWHCVAEVMKQCSQPELAFWKIQLGVVDQDGKTPAIKPSYLPRDLGPEAAPVERLVVEIRWQDPGKPAPRKPQQGAKPAGAETSAPAPQRELTWALGPVRVATAEDLREQLQRIANDPARQVDDPGQPGQKKRMPVVIEAQAGATYGDVIRTHDAILAAGFAEIAFGAGGAPRTK